MANTSYQISIGADFKELDGAFNSINKAIGQVSKTAAKFESAFKGALHGVENQTSRLQNAVRSVLRETSKLASSASPLGGAELGFKTSKFRSQLSDYGLPQDRIDGLIADYEAANGAAIANLSKQIAEARQASFAKLLQDNLIETKKQAEYAKQILHEGRLDNTIHRDTRDVYAKLQSIANSAGVGDIGGQLEQFRLHTAQVIQREIENLERDALAVGRAIKAADITRVESRIGSYREVLGTGEVARLKDLLQTTVSSVAGELQVKSTQSLLDAIQNVVENVTLSSKQLKAQLDSFRIQGESLGIQGSTFDGLDEVKRLTARIQEVERQELLQFQKDTRKRITDNLREILQKTSVDLQQIRKLSADFIQAGGTSDGFAKEGSKSIISELAARVREMVANGSEFTRALEQRYEQLFVSVGVQGEQLASLVGLVKASSSYVNKNAAAMRMTAVREQITKLLNDYNRVEEAVSKAIMDRMRRDWASVSTESFDVTFKGQLDVQKIISERNALVQKLEGIWKPFQKQLADLEQLRFIDFSSYQSQLSEGFVENLKRRLAAVTHAVRQQGGGTKGNIEGIPVKTILSQFDNQLEMIGKDLDKKLYDELEKKFVALRSQLQDVKFNGNVAAMPKDVSAARNLIDTTIQQAIMRRDRELVEIASETKDLLDDITNQLARNDAVKRAKAMLHTGTRRLGGEAALRLELTEIQKAYGELIKSVKHVDKELARKLGEQARDLQRQARENFNRAGGTSGKGDDPYGMHPGIIANYRRQIPMQLTDIVVGLSTGQLPMYVLLQQGGQLKDMFGGIGNAVKEVSKYLLGWKDDMTKVQMAAAALKRVLATVAVGAIAGMALLMKKAADFNSQIKSTTVELKFRGVELSGDEFRNYAERMSQSLGIARTNAAEIFKQIAIDAKLPKESFDSLVEGLEDISTALGNGWDTKGLQETVKLLGESFKDKDSFKELAANYALFTDEQYTAILQLYDQKDAAGAASLAMETLRENTRGAAEEAMTPFQKTVKEAKEELLKQLQVVGDGMPWEAFQSNLTSTMGLVASFIGVVGRATLAVVNLVSALGNKVVSTYFKGQGVWQTAGAKDAANTALREQKRSAWAYNEAALAEARGDIERANVMKSVGEVARKQAAQASEEAKELANRADISFDIANNQLDPAAAEAWKATAEALSTAGKNLAEGAKVSVRTALPNLRRQPNDKEEKPKKGGKGGGKSSMEKEAEGAEKYILKLKEAWENYRQLTKLEQLSFDLENGKVKMTQQQIAVATELAKAIDERTRKQAEELRIMERNRMEAQKMTEVQNKIQEYALQAARMQRADSVVDYYQQMVEYDNQLAQRIRDLNFARDKEVREYYLGGKSNQIADLNAYYDYQINLERQKTEELKKLWDEYYREQIRLGTSWLTGFEKGLDQVAFKVKDLSSEVASAVESWADQMGDALANFVRTGKFDFRSLADSILNDIARMAANDFIRNLIGGFKYGFGTPIADSGHKEVQDRVAQFKSINGVQMVHVVNMPSSGDFGSAISSAFGSSAGDFTLSNPTSIIGNSNRPLYDFSSATQIGKEAAQGIVTATTPTIQAAANSCFGGVEDGLGGLLSRITSGIGNIFSGFGGGGGGGIGGFFGSLFSGIGSFISRIFGFSSGGYTGPGGKYTPAGIVHAGEYVINAAATRRLGLDFLNRLNGYANGGYVSPTPPAVNHDYSKDAGSGLEVNIYNNSNNDVRTQRNASGGLDIFIEQAVNAVAGDIAAGGAVASALQSTYALNRGNGLQRSGY